MKIKLKEKKLFFENKKIFLTNIEEIRENIVKQTNKKKVEICFKGKRFSGIIELSKEELQQLYTSL